MFEVQYLLNLMAINYEIGFHGKIFESSTKISGYENFDSASMMAKTNDKQELPDLTFCIDYCKIQSNPPSNPTKLGNRRP